MFKLTNCFKPILFAMCVSAAPIFGGCSDGGDDPAGDTGAAGGYKPGSGNPADNTSEAFYDWTVLQSRQVVTGVTYKLYNFVHIKERIHVIEVDLTNPKLTVETSMADDLAPNPNANEKHNNGPCLRETLRENIARKRKEGHNIVAGINTGFFDSHVGIPRGVHIEKSELVYLNNPDVRAALTTHLWGFAFYKDRTLGFDERKASGFVRTADNTEYEFYSVNDTILSLKDRKYDANIYTHRLVLEPHRGIFNEVAPDALFIVAKGGSDGITVNTGYQDAVVTDVIDGRKTAIDPPVVTQKGEWIMQVTGAKADKLAASVKKGDKISIKAELKVGDKVAPIDVYNAGMYFYLRNGEYVAPGQVAAETIYQTMNIGANKDHTKLYLFAVDGIKTYRGLDFYEASRVAQKLGLSDVVRFDGGGSTSMWILTSTGGAIVNNITDSNGERSCMNYLHICLTE